MLSISGFYKESIFITIRTINYYGSYSSSILIGIVVNMRRTPIVEVRVTVMLVLMSVGRVKSISCKSLLMPEIGSGKISALNP